MLKSTQLCDILFQNGLYPLIYTNTNIAETLHLYNIQLLRLINLKKKESYKYYINWHIVIIVLKRFVKKRFNKIKQNHAIKIERINTEFTFSPKRILTKTINTLKPIDCYKPLNKTHLYLTIKADGERKCGFTTMFPNINNINNIINKTEYEFIKSSNMCYLFTSYENTIYLRYKHDYIPHKIYPLLTLDNYESILFEYEVAEGFSINKFINSYKYKKKWWSKYVFKIAPLSKVDYITLLYNISKLYFNCIQNDGWILSNNNSNIYKIKPKHHMTIDLLYTDNLLLDRNNYHYNFKYNNNLQNNKIYRCYYENNMWNPKEIRNDKINPNNRDICSYIEKYHAQYWNIGDIIDTRYNNDSIICNSKSIKDNSYLDHIKNNVLDLGCGFNGYTIKKYCKKYVGIDIDPKILINKFKNNTNDLLELYIADLSKTWDLKEQSKIHYYLPNINEFNTKYMDYTFDTLLSINSIHYILQIDNTELFKNFNKFSKKGSIYIIKFLDGNMLDFLRYNDYVSYNGSFVKLEDKNHIKIYYDWCHTTPRIEKIYTKNKLESIFNSSGWELTYYKSDCLKKYKNISQWELYFKCFSTIIFTRTS